MDVIVQITTEWKFQHFSVIQILREINFGEFRCCKTTIFDILWLYVNLINTNFQKVHKFKKIKIQGL